MYVACAPSILNNILLFSGGGYIDSSKIKLI